MKEDWERVAVRVFGNGSVEEGRSERDEERWLTLQWASPMGFVFLGVT